MIKKYEFLDLTLKIQNDYLVKLANNCLSILKKYPKVHDICKNSLELVAQYSNDNSTDATSIALYLNHHNPDLDLSLQEFLVDNDECAIAAIHIIAFATGVIARQAYLDQNIISMPEAVDIAIPEEAVWALGRYQFLLDKGLVPDV